jgi:nucleotide-binding universal stress UspA family protein
MQLFERILFPVDLSDVSPKIVPYVKELAAKFEAEIHLLFVARLFEYFHGIYVPHPSIKNFEIEIERGAQRKLQEFQADFFKDQRCKAQVITGDPAEKILEYASSEGVGLIVIGTHGRKGIDRVLFGSVAEQVVKKASVPVLTVNPYLSGAKTVSGS